MEVAVTRHGQMMEMVAMDGQMMEMVAMDGQMMETDGRMMGIIVTHLAGEMMTSHQKTVEAAGTTTSTATTCCRRSR